jgi:hypothetical protein
MFSGCPDMELTCVPANDVIDPPHILKDLGLFKTITGQFWNSLDLTTVIIYDLFLSKSLLLGKASSSLIPHPGLFVCR